MARQSTLLADNPAPMVIDIQNSAFMERKVGIGHISGYAENMRRARRVVGAAYDSNIPVVFVQEFHRRDMIDHGRKLDGFEDIHCREGEPGTPVASEEVGYKPGDCFGPKRRLSCILGTEMGNLLRGPKAGTLFFVGGMTDVCVDYSFVDGHQSDDCCLVVKDRVGGTSPEPHQASLKAIETPQEGAALSVDEFFGVMGAERMAAE